MKRAVSFAADLAIDLVLGLWVGGAAMIVMTVFHLFGYLDESRGGRGLAGGIAGPLFQRFFLLLLIGWVALAAALVVKKIVAPSPSRGARGALLVFLVLLMFAAAVGEHCFILPKLEAIRREAGLGPDEALSPGPPKDEFNVWHGLSTVLMLLNICFGVGVIGLRIALRPPPPAR